MQSAASKKTGKYVVPKIAFIETGKLSDSNCQANKPTLNGIMPL